MSLEDQVQGVMADVSSLKGTVGDMEKLLGRLDQLTARHSKTIADLLTRIIQSQAVNKHNTMITTSDRSRRSQGQILSEAASAILRAMRRNI